MKAMRHGPIMADGDNDWFAGGVAKCVCFEKTERVSANGERPDAKISGSEWMLPPYPPLPSMPSLPSPATCRSVGPKAHNRYCNGRGARCFAWYEGEGADETKHSVVSD
jgi:hypothetical protein